MDAHLSTKHSWLSKVRAHALFPRVGHDPLKNGTMIRGAQWPLCVNPLGTFFLSGPLREPNADPSSQRQSERGQRAWDEQHTLLQVRSIRFVAPCP